MDPSITYDTVSYEPVLNVYQTLINYNGTDTATYVPTAATCVPSTAGCVADYGSNLTGFVGPSPIYWTYVVDKAANFYDPTTGHHWGVYPTDVMFSVARTMAFADLPAAGLQNGWIISQALEQFGSHWDNSVHFPYNNTPGNVLGSMLINDSTYCPAMAISHEHGCITFVADGSGQPWPNFNQFIADNLGASIEPCAFFTYESSGIPGWTPSVSGHGNHPCLLPNGGNNTSNAAWTTYLAGLNSNAPGPGNLTSWDTFEKLAFHRPAIQPGVQWTMVGSGPYYGGVTPGIGYQLGLNPFYVEPSGCTGIGVAYTYTGYCDPAPAAIQPNVQVYWKSDDSYGISQYNAGLADFAGIETSHTSTMLSLASAGKINIYQGKTISTFFLPFSLTWSSADYASCTPCTGPAGNIPATFLTSAAARGFLTHAYPYTSIENNYNTVDGIQFLFYAGGPIPVGMGNYYPNNVSYPSGNPDTNPADVNGAAWWWHVGITPGSGYFDPVLYACVHNASCSFPIVGEDAAPALDGAIASWITEIKSLTSNALQPTTYDMAFADLLNYPASATPGHNPLAVWNLGWAPDYPDPTDYVPVLDGVDNVYTAPDATAEQLDASESGANATLCGHTTTTYADLVYWAHQATLSTNCQGYAFDAANTWSNNAGVLPESPARILDYNLAVHIFNALNLYVWEGQSNSVTTAAPWIDGSTINTNVMIGGGGDLIWFQIKYVPFETQLTFHGTGLPAGSTWSINGGSPASLKTNTTVGALGTIKFNSPNGTFPFAITPPAGYGVARVIGTAVTTQTSTTVAGIAKTITVQFGKLETLNFNESAILGRQLPSGTTWNVSLTPYFGAAGPAAQSAGNVTSGLTGSISFTVPKGAEYKYAISKPSVFRAIPPHGIVLVPAAPSTHLIQFLRLTAVVEIKEIGLAAGTSWCANVTGPQAFNMCSTAAIKVFHLENGTSPSNYTFTVSNFAAKHPHPSTGTFNVHVPMPALVITITYNSTPAPFASSSLGGVSAPSHWLVAAAPYGREVG